jgi:type I restriction enzyme, S subunit
MYPTKKLSEICSIRTGKKDVNYATEDGLYPFFTCWEKIYNAPDFSFEWSAILIAWNGDVGACKKYDWKFEAYQRTYVLMDFSWVNRDYLFYFLNGNLARLVKAETLGTAIPYIKLGSLTNREIPLPPLSTQSRIVARLDSAFASIDEQISLLRANIEDVENMRKSVLEESFRHEWVQRKIMKDILVTCEYGSSKKSTDDSSWVPVLRMGNIQNWWIDYNNLKYTSKDSEDLPKLYLKKYDLLFNRTNSWELVGKTGIFLWEDDTISFAWYLIRLQFSSDISPIYANYYLNSEYFRKTQIEPQIDQQCGQANFSWGKLKDTEFLYYSLPRQHEIVAHLDEVFDTTRALRAEYEAQIRDLEIFKQSLLEEAFAGRLVEDKE